MIRGVLVAGSFTLTALLLASACGGAPDRGEKRGAAKGATGDAAATGPAGDDRATPAAGSSAKSTVTLWFPSASGEGLISESREIVDTARPADRGTQILTALIEGPKTESALPAVPSATTVRQLWIRSDGIAYADFSNELSQGMSGGSYDELLAVYAIVDSLATNMPSIQRVGILVDGHERQTLGGHLDIRRPLKPDPSLHAAPAEVVSP